jgi:hypothetical protein
MTTTAGFNLTIWPVAFGRFHQRARNFFFNVVATCNGVPANHVWFPEERRLRRGRPLLEDPVVFPVDLATTLRVVGGTVIHPDCWIVRRTLLDEVGGFWERLWFTEDYDMMMRLLDRARQILFRPDPCVDYRLPAGDAHSLRSSRPESMLQDILAAQHVRITCRQPAVRRQARAREAWGMRGLARELRAAGRPGDAFGLAWQGLCTFPTLGAIKDLLG